MAAGSTEQCVHRFNHFSGNRTHQTTRTFTCRRSKFAYYLLFSLLFTILICNPKLFWDKFFTQSLMKSHDCPSFSY